MAASWHKEVTIVARMKQAPAAMSKIRDKKKGGGLFVM
jgi:hypothetical protein